MRVLLYAEEDGGPGDSLRKFIESALPQGKIEIHRNFESLSRRLKEPLANRVVAILLLTSRESLSNILSIQYLLRGMDIILLAPDGDPETIAIAHQLRPRFLTYINSNPEELSAVLDKMLKKNRHG